GELDDVVGLVVAGTASNGAVDHVARHVGGQRLVHGQAQTRVVRRHGAALGRHGQLANQLGEDLAALGILTTLAVLDVGPFGMTSHNSLHLVYEFSSEPLPARQSSVALARTAAAVRCRCAPRTAKPG